VWAGVASLFADATLPSQRGRGIQSALIQHRLAAGRAAGCKLAMAAVQPGSPSHRNYVRAGFQVAYTRAILSRTGS
jgi:GNAT superfamily N-acetyltransferase